MNNNIIGERIQEARKIANMTQKELAQKLHITRACLSNFESGIRDMKTDTIINLSKALNVTTDYLLGLSDAPTNDKDLQATCDYIGFKNSEAVQLLHEYKGFSNGIINNFVCNLTHEIIIKGESDVTTYARTEKALIHTINTISQNIYNIDSDERMDIMSRFIELYFTASAAKKALLSNIDNYLNIDNSSLLRPIINAIVTPVPEEKLTDKINELNINNDLLGITARDIESFLQDNNTKEEKDNGKHTGTPE